MHEPWRDTVCEIAMSAFVIGLASEELSYSEFKAQA